jgi:enhancing lycopene biosynthesis protein 2
MRKYAVILAGSGVFDGSEIHEATLTMLAIMQHGGTYQCFAPDTQQHHVVNHLSGDEMPETRNVLIESARIARGNVKNILELKAKDYDALVIPGGFGVAKNLCDYAVKGAEFTVIPELEKVLKEFQSAGKPIAALCISPVIISKVFEGAKVTIGQDEGTAKHINEIGGHHVSTSHGEVIFDEQYKIFTTPCYMLDANIEQIYQGAFNIIKALSELK